MAKKSPREQPEENAIVNFHQFHGISVEGMDTLLRRTYRLRRLKKNEFALPEECLQSIFFIASDGVPYLINRFSEQRYELVKMKIEDCALIKLEAQNPKYNFSPGFVEYLSRINPFSDFQDADPVQKNKNSLLALIQWLFSRNQ